MTSQAPLWTPSPERAAGSLLAQFTAHAAARTGRALDHYDALHAWSVAERGEFWSLVWDVCGVVGDKGTRWVDDGDRMPGARFFPESRLNYARNLLRHDGDGPAIISTLESGAERVLSWRDLRNEVSRCAQAMRAAGVVRGDRVAAVISNIPEAIIGALAAASLGAVWSSCSPDFGAQGILDRFGQIEPRLLIAVESYQYAGKTHDCREKLAAVVSQLPSLSAVWRLAGPEGPVGPVGPVGPDAPPLTFEDVPFEHPLYILYSSGTTGVPKCIVHGHGGTLLQHLKEHQLHADVRPGDRVFYFTTCGWMMWNWQVSALASGATLVLYDGSPFFPDGQRLLTLAQRWQVSLFGTSAKFIDAVQKAGLTPATTHDLSSVRTVTSTGSPLSPEGFAFVYRAMFPHAHLASISGGTDIVSCFVGGVPTMPVWAGEIQGPGLGMAVDVFAPDGAPIPAGAGQGELVCTQPFPSMPIGFWNDPDGAKYRAAYFERFPGVWCHGDWIERTAHGGFIIHGRSDATLNPGGVRIGTAEIYRQVEKLPEVIESLAVGQKWEGDERILLFVRLREGVVLDDALRSRIATTIRANTSPRHVPARIFAVADLPRTKSGKLVELAVRQVIHGEPVKNREALANPEALDQFRGLQDP